VWFVILVHRERRAPHDILATIEIVLALDVILEIPQFKPLPAANTFAFQGEGISLSLVPAPPYEVTAKVFKIIIWNHKISPLCIYYYYTTNHPNLRVSRPAI
jgi:hypothetical protein